MDLDHEAIRALLRHPPVVVPPDATLREVAETLAEDYIGAAIVRGSRPMGASASRAQGIISERDIVRALAEGSDPDVERAGDVMTLDLATVTPGETVTAVAQRMIDNEIRHVPVTDDHDVVVGVVSERDMVRALLSRPGFASPTTR